jgi:hypothetical protein
MHDIIDVIKNIQSLSEHDKVFQILKDFERVVDALDIYVFKNWRDGEIIDGPHVSRYMVTCTFMWDRKKMPDPEGGRRLSHYGCDVKYKKDHILVPRKIKDPEDYRPGTKKGKIDAHPIWTVRIEMPKKLMQDVYIGKENKETNRMAEMMRYSAQEIATSDSVAQEAPENAENPQSTNP